MTIYINNNNIHSQQYKNSKQKTKYNSGSSTQKSPVKNENAAAPLHCIILESVLQSNHCLLLFLHT